MIEIITAEIAARDTIKAELEREIPSINETIKKAKAEGRTEITVKRHISGSTINMLRSAGYMLKCVEPFAVETISWKEEYTKLSGNYAQLEEIAKEIQIEIVKPGQAQ